MSPGNITDVLDAVEELQDKVLAKKLLYKWIQSAATRPEYQQVEEMVFESRIKKLNTEVLDTLNQMRDRQHPPITVVEALNRIERNSGWGERERIALVRSTVQNYEDALRQIRNDALAHFLQEHLGWLRSGSYDENFKNGVDNFLTACRNIVTSNLNSRAPRITRGFQ